MKITETLVGALILACLVWVGYLLHPIAGNINMFLFGFFLGYRVIMHLDNGF